MKTASKILLDFLILGALAQAGGCQDKGSGDGGGDEALDGADGGGTVDDPCGVCPPGYYAVDCGFLWGLGERPNSVCGIGKENAEYLCEWAWDGVVLASPSDNCPFPAAPWNPSLNIYADPSGSGATLIEVELLDRLEQQPQDLYLDATRVEWDEDGNVVVSTEGELSVALGLRVGDVLVGVNGYEVSSMLDTVALYGKLRDNGRLTLSLVRQGARMKMEYVIQ